MHWRFNRAKHSLLTMTRICLISLCLALGACGDWPDVPETSRHDSSSEWPNLLPWAEIVGPVSEDPLSDEDAELLAARARALQARATILRSSVRDADEMEALRARLAR